MAEMVSAGGYSKKGNKVTSLYKNGVKLLMSKPSNPNYWELDIDFVKPEYRQMIVADLKLLLINLRNKGVLKPGGEWEFALSTEYMAVSYFYEILSLLEQMPRMYNAGMAKNKPGEFIALFQYGDNPFMRAEDRPIARGENRTKNSVIRDLGKDYNKAFARTQEELLKKDPREPVFALAILNSPIDWNLSFEDVADLFSPHQA